MIVSSIETLFTGTYMDSKQFSIIKADKSESKTPNSLSSCKIIALAVFCTDLNIASLFI